MKTIKNLPKNLPVALPEAELLVIRGGLIASPNPGGDTPLKTSSDCGVTNTDKCDKCSKCDKCIICF